MIELPESKTLAKQFRDTLTGKRVEFVVTGKSPHKWAWLSEIPGGYDHALGGRTVTGGASHGGMAELQFEGASLVFGDGTNVRFFEAGANLPQKHQLHVGFDDGSSLICSVQMYGGMWLHDESYVDEGYYKSSKTKIKPLDSAFDEAHLDSLLGSVKQTISVKAFLATEQRMPGLGNGVLQDILFNAGVHPKSKLSSLDDAKKRRIFGSVWNTLSGMVSGGGRDTERDLFGKPGGYRTRLSAKTKDYPCPVCGGPIVREAYLGGNVYYCPVCQPL